MSTLTVVEEVLRAAATPLCVREIIELAGDRLPTKSVMPQNVVARDLAVDLKKHGELSRFVRTSLGRYAVRELATNIVDSALSARPCKEHPSHPSYGCPACDRYRHACTTLLKRTQRARGSRPRLSAAEWLLLYRVDDYAGAASAREVRRSKAQLFAAAMAYVAEVRP